MLPQTEKTSSSDETGNIKHSASDLRQNAFNIQKYLLILLSVQWFVCVIILGIGIYSIVSGNATDISSGIQSLIPIIGLTLYYTFGILVTYKQHRIGLLIFVSVGIILFLAASIFVGYIILAVVALSIGFGNTNQGYEKIVFIGIFFAIIAIVAILTIKFAFNLGRLIAREEHSTA